MRLAYLISQYPAVNHTFILREVRQLRAIGWDINTISVRGCDREVQELTQEEVEEYSRTTYLLSTPVVGVLARHLATFVRRPLAYLRTLLFALRLGHRTPRRALWNLFYFAEAVVLDHILTRGGVDHVHAHFASTLALLTHHLSGTPYSVTIHGPDEFTDPVGSSLEPKIDAAEFVVAISDYARSQLMRYTDFEIWHKYEVNRLGVDPEIFRPTPGIDDEDSFNLICIGRLAPVKGQFILISALAELREMGHPARLLLVGDGPDRGRLEEAVDAAGLTDVVEFHGWLNQDGVQALLARADLFVLASFAEGIPVVLMEAMAARLPCVATRVNGIPELIRDGVDGVLVSPSSVTELVSAAATLIDSSDLRVRLAVNARERVVEAYNLRENSAALSKIFSRRLLASDQSSGATAATSPTGRPRPA
jgi:glycosyltransferase involved in cell wall biosynthesis